MIKAWKTSIKYTIYRWHGGSIVVAAGKHNIAGHTSFGGKSLQYQRMIDDVLAWYSSLHALGSPLATVHTRYYLPRGNYNVSKGRLQ